MAKLPTLLPSNGKPFIRALEQTLAYERRVSGGVDVIYNIKGQRLAEWLPFLLYEYGLLELTPYVPSPYLLLDQGRQWQNERDTFAAVLRGLGWVNAPGEIVEAPTRRAWWNSFQIYLDSLPAQDFPDLERIDRITQLGKPFRSDFRRGVNGYDIPTFEADRTRLDSALLDTESGVRLRPGGPLWSFGRVHEVSHTMTEAEGTAIGNWLPPAAAASYSIDMRELVGTIEGEPVAFSDVATFSRATTKWHNDLAGNWHEFAIDEVAATDRGASIEPEATRLSPFAISFNPLDDEAAAVVALVDVADPFGGNDAVRMVFDGDAGNVLYVPTEALDGNEWYSLSFFAKLISVSGTVTGAGGPGFMSIYPQLVLGQWVRVIGAPFRANALIDGNWFDLTLDSPGVVLTIELHGFQIEVGAKVTSPIPGATTPATRAADMLSLLLPDGLNNVNATFSDGSGQSFLQVTPPFDIDASSLERPVITEIANLSAATWKSMAFPWTEATFPWNSDLSVQRNIALAEWFENREVWFALRDGAGALIGYRGARVVRQVVPSFLGRLRFAGASYAGSASGQLVIAEAMTDAGNGVGRFAASVELVVGATRAVGIPPGRRWLEPNQLSGGHSLAVRPISIPLRATVRERVKLLLRF